MKVYITGMGAVTSLGLNVESSFQALLENRSGVRAYPEWKNHKGLFTHLGAPVPAYNIQMIPRSARRTMSRMSEMGVLASLEAIQQSDLQINQPEIASRSVLVMGSTTGSPDTLETYFRKLFERGGPEGQMGTTFFKAMNHSIQANVASALGFKGPSFSPSCACATSAQALILGWEMIQSGHYDIVIAGGGDELHYTTAAVFDVVQAASRGYNDQPDLAPSPFDQSRDGLVVSEGAAVIVLESERSVQRRGVRKLAEFKGGAYVCDGSHMSQSKASTMVEVMQTSLERARLNRSDVHYVNAHATGTIQGDQEEAQAIGEVFGKTVPVSSLKGHFGHSLAACGALEVAMSVHMMNQGIVIPTRNLKQIDPSCSTVRHVQEKQPMSIQTVLSNNFAFGGMNTSLIVSSITENS